jgi:hypothetical protein
MQSEKSRTVIRATAVFFIILFLFFVIEIMPMHFGAAGRSWQELIPEIRTRLPRILLIAVGAALFLSMGEKRQKGGKE